MAPWRRRNFFFQKWVGEILGSKVPPRYIQHCVNSRRGIAGLPCIVKNSKSLLMQANTFSPLTQLCQNNSNSKLFRGATIHTCYNT